MRACAALFSAYLLRRTHICRRQEQVRRCSRRTLCRIRLIPISNHLPRAYCRSHDAGHNKDPKFRRAGCKICTHKRTCIIIADNPMGFEVFCALPVRCLLWCSNRVKITLPHRPGGSIRAAAKGSDRARAGIFAIMYNHRGQNISPVPVDTVQDLKRGCSGTKRGSVTVPGACLKHMQGRQDYCRKTTIINN